MRTIHRTIVSALIYSKDNKLLMGKKDPKQGGVYNDCWHIPGGGVDSGEEKLEALKREILEEVGINISEQHVEFVTDKDTGTSEKTLPSGEKVIAEMQFNVYKITMDKDSSEIQLSSDGDLVELRWFDIIELAGVKLTPPSTKYFKEIGYIK